MWALFFGDYLKFFYVPFFILLLTSTKIFAGETHPEAQVWIEKSRQLQLSQKKQWVDLLHYRRNIFGLMRSQIVGEEFFLAPDGYKNAQAEMEATLNAFFDSPAASENKHPLCLFPGRKRWLASQLSIPENTFSSPPCPLYGQYIRRLKAESVSAVFSSYYANNPGSAFGHTLFRINHKLQPHETRNELLDYGIGFAADVTTNNPAIYALFGVIGGFSGSWTNVPYYYKVREYNDSESRAIWSYDLELSQEEVDLLVDHLWEVGGSRFDYYFFTQNCGFHMLTVLEASAPRLSVAEQISFYVIPSDAIKVMTKEDQFIRKVSYRPSAKDKFRYRWSQLSEEQKNIFRDWRNSRDIQKIKSSSLPQDQKIQLLDATLEFFDYKFPPESSTKDSHFKERQSLLLSRAEVTVPSPVLNVPTPEFSQPDLGHASGRLGFHIGNLNLPERPTNPYQEINMRFALHDFMDPPDSYPENSSIEFMNFRARNYSNNSLLQLEELTVFNLYSLAPLDEFEDAKSWKFGIMGKKVYDFRCMNCFAGGFEGGFGYTYQNQKKTFYFGMLDFSVLYADGFSDQKLFVTAGPHLGIIHPFSRQTFFRLESQLHLPAFRNLAGWAQSQLEFRHNFNAFWSVGLLGLSNESSSEARLSLYHFL